jgi:hypothetical protein
MSKTKAVSTLTPKICEDFSGNQNDIVAWKNLPPTCTITQLSPPASNPFPFSPARTNGNGLLYIDLPLPVPTAKVTISAGPGTYEFNVGCCPTESQTHTVTVDS